MNDSGILRPDRLLALVAMAFSPVLLLVFGGGTYVPYALMVFVAVAISSVAAEAGFLRDNKGTKQGAPKLSTPLLVFILISFASVLWSIDAGKTLEKLPYCLAYFLSFWTMARAVPKQRKAIFFAIQVPFSTVIAYSLFGYIAEGAFSGGGPSFPMPDNASYSALSVFTLSLSLSQLLGALMDEETISEQASAASRIAVIVVSGAGAAISAGALSFTASPIVLLLGLAVMVGIAAARSKPGLLKSSVVIIASVAVGLLFALTIATFAGKGDAVAPFLPALKGTVGSFIADLDYMSYHWVIAARLGIQRIISGFGLGTFERALPLAYVPADFHPGTSAQSFVMQAFSETGLIGAGALLAFAASVLMSLIKRMKVNEPESFYLFPPYIAMLAFLFIGNSFEAPLMPLLFFMLAGASSAGMPSRKPDANGKIVRAAFFVAVVVTAAISVNSILAFNARQEAEHYIGHGEYEEAMPALRKAIDLNSLDSSLYMYLASTELRLAVAGVEGHSEDAALRYAEVAVDLSPYNPGALQLRGLLLKHVVEDGSWMEDFKQASSFAADDVSPNLMIADEGLRTGDLALAGEYIDLAKLNEPLLASGADMQTADGINDLSDLIQLKALSYALALKSGDVEEAEANAQALRDLEGKYPEIHGYVHDLFVRYGVEDPIH